MLKWIVFGVVWGFGLFLADLIHAAGNFANTSQVVIFGGLWMLLCSGIRDFIEGYQPAASNKHGKEIAMEFQDFPKMARLARDVIVTEKIDGTNAQVCIAEDGTLLAGSRTRWITTADDNFGFAAWVEAHRDELLTLGPGRHFGEWWGSGIQRGYGLKEKRFSLFNATRWAAHDQPLLSIPSQDPRALPKWQERPPACCSVVPVLIQGQFRTDAVDACIQLLRERGSYAAPGFMKPEGVVVFHTAGNVGFKKTIEKDEMPKTLARHEPANVEANRL